VLFISEVEETLRTTIILRSPDHLQTAHSLFCHRNLLTQFLSCSQAKCEKFHYLCCRVSQSTLSATVDSHSLSYCTHAIYRHHTIQVQLDLLLSRRMSEVQSHTILAFSEISRYRSALYTVHLPRATGIIAIPRYIPLYGFGPTVSITSRKSSNIFGIL
jgi:hypothetical protein